MLAKIGYWE